MIKRAYIYITIIIIFLFVLSSIKQQSKEGFLTPWYKSDYFIIPLLGTLIITGPLLFLLYKYMLQPINKSLTAST